MENAAEALKMAAWALIFVVTLSISINAFGEVRKTSQTILNYQDREYDQMYVNEIKDKDGKPITERTVGAESIVPTIYKAYKENYKIVFTKNALNNNFLYKKNNVEIYRIDLEKDVIGNDTDKENFLKALLNGENKEDFISQEISFSNTTLYDMIKGKYFKESIGLYYQEEILGGTQAPNANKTLKRVITYDIIE